jgi:hypothetical protein
MFESIYATLGTLSVALILFGFLLTGREFSQMSRRAREARRSGAEA